MWLPGDAILAARRSWSRAGAAKLSFCANHHLAVQSSPRSSEAWAVFNLVLFPRADALPHKGMGALVMWHIRRGVVVVSTGRWEAPFSGDGFACGACPLSKRLISGPVRMTKKRQPR